MDTRHSAVLPGLFDSIASLSDDAAQRVARFRSAYPPSGALTLATATDRSVSNTKSVTPASWIARSARVISLHAIVAGALGLVITLDNGPAAVAQLDPELRRQAGFMLVGIGAVFAIVAAAGILQLRGPQSWPVSFHGSDGGSGPNVGMGRY